MFYISVVITIWSWEEVNITSTYSVTILDHPTSIFLKDGFPLRKRPPSNVSKYNPVVEILKILSNNIPPLSEVISRINLCMYVHINI